MRTTARAAACPRCQGRHSMVANDDGHTCRMCGHATYDAPTLMAQRSAQRTEDRRSAMQAGQSGVIRAVHGYSVPYVGGVRRLMGQEIQIVLKKSAAPAPICPYCVKSMDSISPHQIAGAGKHQKRSRWYSCGTCPRRILIAKNNLNEAIGWS